MITEEEVRLAEKEFITAREREDSSNKYWQTVRDARDNYQINPPSGEIDTSVSDNHNKKCADAIDQLKKSNEAMTTASCKFAAKMKTWEKETGEIWRFSSKIRGR